MLAYSSGFITNSSTVVTTIVWNFNVSKTQHENLLKEVKERIEKLTFSEMFDNGDFHYAMQRMQMDDWYNGNGSILQDYFDDAKKYAKRIIDNFKECPLTEPISTDYSGNIPYAMAYAIIYMLLSQMSNDEYRICVKGY